MPVNSSQNVPIFRLRWLACLALTIAVPNLAQGAGKPIPDNRLGMPTAPLLLLSRPEVRHDLGFNPEQADDAEKAISELYLKAYALRGKTGNIALAERRRIDQEQRQWLETHLSEKQRERLSQIELQWEGASALVARPIVRDSLRLTPEQIEKLKLGKAKRDASRKASPDDWRRIEAEWTTEALAILNESQRAIWKSMLGFPLKFELAETSGATAKK